MISPVPPGNPNASSSYRGYVESGQSEIATPDRRVTSKIWPAVGTGKTVIDHWVKEPCDKGNKYYKSEQRRTQSVWC